MAFIQWKVKSVGYTDTFDNEPAARRDYGKLKAEIKEENEGWVEFYARETLKANWELQQEFRLNEEEEGDDD